jgi:hypothetical protein
VTRAAIDYHSHRDDPVDGFRLHSSRSRLGDNVARAKRTDRAEARRKYRAYLQAQEETGAEASAEEGPVDSAAAQGAKPVRGVERKPQPTIPPGQRMGLFAAAKSAYRQPHYLDDLRNIRALVFRTNAIWPVVIVCAIAGAYTVAGIDKSGRTTDPIIPSLVTFLFAPVPLLPPMLAGFLAPRSTWLAGMLASLIATLTLVGVIALTALRLTSAGGIPTESPSIQPSAIVSASAGPSTSAVATLSPTPIASAVSSPSAGASSTPVSSGTTTGNSPADLVGVLFQLLATSLAFGALMGAASGWYKRFLSYTSVPRNRPPSRPSSRSPQRRPAKR